MNPLKKKEEVTSITNNIFGLYAIKDELAGFAPPVICEDDKRAKRWFKSQLENNVLMRDNPTDFSLWLIGYYHTGKGIIRPLPENELTKVDWGVKNEE